MMHVCMLGVTGRLGRGVLDTDTEANNILGFAGAPGACRVKYPDWAGPEIARDPHRRLVEWRPRRRPAGVGGQRLGLGGRLAHLFASSQYKSHVSLLYIPAPPPYDFYDPSPCTLPTSVYPPQSSLVVVTGLLSTMGYLGFIWPFVSVRPPHLFWPGGTSGSRSGGQKALGWLPYRVSPLNFLHTDVPPIPIRPPPSTMSKLTSRPLTLPRSPSPALRSLHHSLSPLRSS